MCFLILRSHPTTNNFETQQTINEEGKRLPEEKMDSNFSLNKSNTSRPSIAEKRVSGVSNIKSIKSGLSNKKRQTTFCKPGENFFGVEMRRLARKKSTSNFLCNFGIIERKSENSSNKDKSSTSDLSEEDEFVDELEDIAQPYKEEMSRMDSKDFQRTELLRKHVRVYL